jgi:hypothetical protein
MTAVSFGGETRRSIEYECGTKLPRYMANGHLITAQGIVRRIGVTRLPPTPCSNRQDGEDPCRTGYRRLPDQPPSFAETPSSRRRR